MGHITIVFGGDWNHGILNDFPIYKWNVMIPSDELHHFQRGRAQGRYTTIYIYTVYIYIYYKYYKRDKAS